MRPRRPHGLFHLTGDAVGADEHAVLRAEFRGRRGAEDASRLIVGQDLRIVDDGAEGADVPAIGMLDGGVQLLQGQAHPHAEPGRFGA